MKKRWAIVIYTSLETETEEETREKAWEVLPKLLEKQGFKGIEIEVNP